MFVQLKLFEWLFLITKYKYNILYYIYITCDVNKNGKFKK